MVDGNGILHTRSFGLACHLGVVTGLPTLGVSKNMFAVDGLTKAKTKELFEKTTYAGEYVDLIGNSGKRWGVAYRSADNIVNPIFISTGHRISLDTAIEIVFRTCFYRVAEPVR